MPRPNHYSPAIDRFLVCVLYHQSKVEGIPMTSLANQIVKAGLKDSEGWKLAEQQMRPETGLAEQPIEYRVK